MRKTGKFALIRYSKVVFVMGGGGEIRLTCLRVGELMRTPPRLVTRIPFPRGGVGKLSSVLGRRQNLTRQATKSAATEHNLSRQKSEV